MSASERQRRARSNPVMAPTPGFSLSTGVVQTSFFGSSFAPQMTSPRRPPCISRMSAEPPSSDGPRRVRGRDLFRITIATAGIAAGGMFGFSAVRQMSSPSGSAPPAVAAEDAGWSGQGPIPLRALGIKQSDYLGERELRMRKTTQYSEAEEEIMELEEYEVSTKWFRDLQAMWAGVASIAGIAVLYKGGVLWERWIQEQERKDMEEEIELTGKFISPRAVRKDGDEEDNQGKKKGKDGKGGGDGKPPTAGDSPPGDIDALNKLLGNK